MYVLALAMQATLENCTKRGLYHTELDNFTKHYIIRLLSARELVLPPNSDAAIHGLIGKLSLKYSNSATELPSDSVAQLVRAWQAICQVMGSSPSLSHCHFFPLFIFSSLFLTFKLPNPQGPLSKRY